MWETMLSWENCQNFIKNFEFFLPHIDTDFGLIAFFFTISTHCRNLLPFPDIALNNWRKREKKVLTYEEISILKTTNID